MGIGDVTNSIHSSGVMLEKKERQFIRFVQTSDFPQSYIFLASTKGVYFNSKRDNHWHRLPYESIPVDSVTSLRVLGPPSHGNCAGKAMDCYSVLVGSSKGAFLFKDGGWSPVYKGMETNNIRYLAKDTRETVYAATDRGLFFLPLREALPSLMNSPHRRVTTSTAGDWTDVDKPFRDEPTISEVHRIAIDYAEVNPEKIKSWRYLSKKRAWFPELDVSFDGQRDWSSSDSIWGSYSIGGQHYVGPDDKTRGEDFGWDVSLSWDLGDLIWSSDQTAIDSRSKLMVELREDILDQITRLYFERRRIQVELAANEVFDHQLKIDKKMRIEELTALIDAFTGGEFSRRIAAAVNDNLIAADKKEKEEM